jgi:hypothetical protein
MLIHNYRDAYMSCASAQGRCRCPESKRVTDVDRPFYSDLHFDPDIDKYGFALGLVPPKQ